MAIRFGLLRAIPNATVFVPVDNGAFGGVGLEVPLQYFTNTTQIMVSVGSGQLDMGSITLGAAAFNALNRGLDLKIIASGTQSPSGHGNPAPAIARADLYDSGALRTPAQLRDHKFAINGKGNILEYGTAKLVAKGGLQQSALQIEYMPFPEMVTALGNHSIDAAMMLEPIATVAISKGVGKLLSDDYMPNAQIASIVVNRAFAVQHSEAVTRFLQVYVKAAREFDDGGLRRDAAALSILQKYTKVAPDVIRKVPDNYWPKDGRVNLPSLDDQQKFYLHNRSVDYSEPLDLGKLIDYSYLDAALKQLGG